MFILKIIAIRMFLYIACYYSEGIKFVLLLFNNKTKY